MLADCPHAMRPIPDHDGRPLPPDRRRQLADRLADIDRWYPGSPFRRAFRAAACRHFGDEMGEHREMAMLLAEAADFHGIDRNDVNRLTMPIEMFLARKARREARN